MHRQTSRIGLAFLGGLAALVGVSNDASAQVAGSAGRPLPNVLLLVDNSGSMERKPDNNLPTCEAGKSKDINRWGMLLQALTGNFMPYFSCEAVSRSKATNPNFAKRYSIAGADPYDTDYFLPYHQPMTGTNGDACVIAPWKLPGAATGDGVGSDKLGADGYATDYPDTALAAYKYTSLGTGLPDPLDASGICTFDQNNDGQLDVSKAYARFALMTFDSLVDRETGLKGSYPTQKINEVDPFKGMWSYLRHTGNPFFSTSSNTSGIGDGAQGMPGTTPACLPTFQEVGARNAGAPPWEGRLIPFANPDATLYELDAQNALIQQTLIATRPFGATPIDGLMDDARDFLFQDPQGPKDDTYKCRDKYIILLTDGAPNLNLRPSCEATNGVCPYPSKAEVIAHDMFTLPDAQKVTTFVIGFSVNGTSPVSGADGFPPGLTKNDCKTWFDTAAGGTTDEKVAAQKMEDACVATPPAAGTTGEACCQLNRIALQGSEQGAFFAESQADIVLAFGRIMANIIHSASTKTLPALSPAVQFSSFAKEKSATSVASSAQFIASYIPSSQTPWSGELDRTRYLCESGVSTPQPLSRTAGDFQSENVANQANKKERIFITAIADKASSAIDSAATIRPFALNGVDALGSPATAGSSPYVATELAMTGYTLGFAGADWPLALNVTDKTCRGGRAVKRGTGTGRGTTIIPALTDTAECSEVIWGFATAYPDKIEYSGYDFNVRCNGASTATGKCSISGTNCVPSNPVCGAGETCVPDCAAMGAIYHSTPAVIGPPTSLLREEGFRNHQKKYAQRRTIMYAATTDGLLHAFDAMKQGGPELHHELWAFAPPAVLPKLAANYPGGNQIILDGAPVVKEVVWDREATQLNERRKWHTTLVAGLGTTGGYYAMNVTDGDCSDGGGSEDCLGKYVAPGKSQAQDVGLPVDAAGNEGTPKRGPHFLWQLTDVPAATSGEVAKINRESLIDKVKMAALFGKNTGTPAIGTVQIKASASSPEHQVGIAILPGGYDDPPIAGDDCPRATKSAAQRLDDATGFAGGTLGYRTRVRKWAKGPCDTAPVPGRNVTIVRLDTGEILRIFGRVQDTPTRLADKLKGSGGLLETPFDSPMVGTPVIYPDQVGVPIQRVFIGDADGTLWRIDLSSTDPADWKAGLFADLIGKATSANAAASQPIQVPPVLSTDENGALIINAATGDQESVVASDTLENFVYALRDARVSNTTPKAELLWYKTLTKSERVTGPMTVFDKTLYFATYVPERGGTTVASCNSPGAAWLWGMSYIKPKGVAGDGGENRWCPAASVDTTATGAGLCTAPSLLEKESAKDANPTDPGLGKDIIPGVTLASSQACVGNDTTDEYGNSMFSTVSQTQYSLSFGISRPNTKDNNKAQAARGSVNRPLPRMPTQINSWSLVLE